MIWMNFANAESFMPTAATEISKQVNGLYAFLLISSFIACAILIGGMIYFAFKYKRKSDSDKTPYISHNTFLEFLWSFIPLVIFIAVFAWGWLIYHDMRSMPKDALEIHVYGRQWSWEFEYKNGYKSPGKVYVPVNKDVKLIMTSQDVLHSFYVPSFRIKHDVVPGMYTALWFKSEKLGEFNLFCAEYCGSEHSGMFGKIVVLTQAEFDAKIESGTEEFKAIGSLPMVPRGEKLFQLKGCVGCHSVADATIKMGPSLYKKFGTEEELVGGQKVMVDDNYLRESIVNSQAKIVKGFSPAMPIYQGQLNESDVTALVEYLKSLK